MQSGATFPLSFDSKSHRIWMSWTVVPAYRKIVALSCVLRRVRVRPLWTQQEMARWEVESIRLAFEIDAQLEVGF